MDYKLLIITFILMASGVNAQSFDKDVCIGNYFKETLQQEFQTGDYIELRYMDNFNCNITQFESVSNTMDCFNPDTPFSLENAGEGIYRFLIDQRYSHGCSYDTIMICYNENITYPAEFTTNIIDCDIGEATSSNTLYDAWKDVFNDFFADLPDFGTDGDYFGEILENPLTGFISVATDFIGDSLSVVKSTLKLVIDIVKTPFDMTFNFQYNFFIWLQGILFDLGSGVFMILVIVEIFIFIFAFTQKKDLFEILLSFFANNYLILMAFVGISTFLINLLFKGITLLIDSVRLVKGFIPFGGQIFSD